MKKSILGAVVAAGAVAAGAAYLMKKKKTAEAVLFNNHGYTIRNDSNFVIFFID